MNILFISPQPYPYGMAASKRIRLFAEYLAKNNRVKAIICGRNNGGNDINGIKDGVEWRLIPFIRLDYFMNFTKIHRILKNNFKKGEDNVIMLYDGIGLTNILFAIIGRKLGYKVFTDIVEDYSVHEEKTGVLLTVMHKLNAFFDKKIDKYIDGIIVISETLLRKYSFVDKTKVYRITISAENLVYKSKQITRDTLKFVYSGSYGNKDGVGYLIDAFTRLKTSYSNVELVLSGVISSQIRLQIKNKSGINYLGLIPDEEYYIFLSNADVLLMTRVDSKYANTGFPFKLGEYLATGNVVIVTNVSDISLYLKDRKSALIAEPSDTESLYKKMEYAILNREECKKIGQRGFEVCNKFFNPEVNGRQLEAFIKKVFND